MGKPKTAPRFKDNQAGATAKFLRVPPRKARLVIDAVRGKYVADALAILKFVPNNAARAIEKVITSAVANAENSRPVPEGAAKALAPLIPENLKLVRAQVDEGPRIKRVQPRAQGRAYRILKRMCHISVIVEECAPKPKPIRRQTGRRSVAAVAGARPAVARTKAPSERTKKAKAEDTKPEEAPAAVEETVTPMAEAATTETPETPASQGGQGTTAE